MISYQLAALRLRRIRRTPLWRRLLANVMILIVLVGIGTLVNWPLGTMAGVIIFVAMLIWVNDWLKFE